MVSRESNSSIGKVDLYHLGRLSTRLMGPERSLAKESLLQSSFLFKESSIFWVYISKLAKVGIGGDR